MKSFKNSILDTVYFNKTASELNVSCEVIIELEILKVIIEGYESIYLGRSLGHGHWVFAYEEGKATLHRTSDQSPFLEGFWIEGAEKGFWRIELCD